MGEGEEEHLKGFEKFLKKVRQKAALFGPSVLSATEIVGDWESLLEVCWKSNDVAQIAGNSNEIVIGQGATGNGTNTATIGTSSIPLYIPGGIATAYTASITVTGTGTLLSQQYYGSNSLFLNLAQYIQGTYLITVYCTTIREQPNLISINATAFASCNPGSGFWNVQSLPTTNVSGYQITITGGQFLIISTTVSTSETYKITSLRLV